MKSLNFYLKNTLYVIVLLTSSCVLEEEFFVKSKPTAVDATKVTSTSFTANWTPMLGTSTYIVDIAVDPGFTTFVEGFQSKEIEGTSLGVTGLKVNQLYYYRVSGKKGNTISPASNIIELTTTNLSRPVALPALDATPSNFTASWEHVDGAEKYLLQISENPDFTSPTIKETSETGFEVSSLDIESVYYYRVRASDEASFSEFSNIIAVTTSQIPIPAAKEPTDVFPQVFTAQWNSVEKATGYILEVATDIDFQNIMPDYNGIEMTDTSQVVKLFSFRVGKTHYYRVKAKSATSVSAYSNIVEVGSGVPSGCHITQIHQLTSDEDRAYNYKYDAAGKLIEVVQTNKGNLFLKVIINYTKEGKVDQALLYTSSLELDRIYEYEYDGDRLKTIILIRSDLTIAQYWVYEYDYNNRITKWDVYSSTTDLENNLMDSYVYEYAKGGWNPERQYNGKTGRLVVEWLYDDAPGATALLPYDLLLFAPAASSMRRKTNTKGFMEVNNFVLQNWVSSFDAYAYLYNDQGFPTRRLGDNRYYTYTTACGFTENE